MAGANGTIVRVTEWVNDNADRFMSSHGKLTHREWLQAEKTRIGTSVPRSDPVIRLHDEYFHKDSHGRRRHKVIALFRRVDPMEFYGENCYID